MSSQPTLVIVPGWRNSGPGHWQSLWSERLGHAVRVEMAEDDWQRPKRHLRVQAIASVIRAQPGPVVVTTRFAPSARLGPMRGLGAVKSCVCKTQATSMSNLATASGPWAWPFCNP
jgi:hypothetical protein